MKHSLLSHMNTKCHTKGLLPQFLLLKHHVYHSKNLQEMPKGKEPQSEETIQTSEFAIIMNMLRALMGKVSTRQECVMQAERWKLQEGIKRKCWKKKHCNRNK